MSMGWTFHSFDPERWRAWTSGNLSEEQRTRLRTAVLWDHDEDEGLSALADSIATIGLESTWQKTSDPRLDSVLCGLFITEGLEAELRLKGYLDPIGERLIKQLVDATRLDSPARLLLTGRRFATGAATSEPRYVLFTALEGERLALDLAVATREHASLEAWERQELESGFAELADDARAGRPVFANFG